MSLIESFSEMNTRDGSESRERKKWFLTLPGILIIAMVSCTVFMFIAACLNINSAKTMDDGNNKALLIRMSDQLKQLLDNSKTTETPPTTTTENPPAPSPPNEICSAIPEDDRIDCHPEENPTPSTCSKRGCCWKEVEQIPPTPTDPTPVNVPKCFFGPSHKGYRVSKEAQNNGDSITMGLRRNFASGLPNDVQDVSVTVTFYDHNTARITITDAKKQRFVPPVPSIADKSTQAPTSYTIKVENDTVLEILRHTLSNSSSPSPIFKTDLAKMIFAEQFMQLTVDMPSDEYYGLGEMKGAFMKKFNRTRRVLFNKDQPPRWNRALYGAHGFMINVEETGAASGIFIHNSNIMDVVLMPSRKATFRALGGVFDFFVYVGRSPAQVIQQYQQTVGFPAMPPYWALGFHLCRYGYWTLNKTEETYQRNVDAGVAVETMWNDIDYMDHFNMFTYDSQENFTELPEFVKEVHDSGRHYMMIFDPAVSGSEKEGTYPPYDIGVQMDIFIKNMTGDIAVYKVWNEKTSIFPDFTHPRIDEYWGGQFGEFHKKIPFDGAWIDMNEPSNQLNGTREGCASSSLDEPPVVIGGEALNTFTLCMSDVLYLSTHYDLHNTYPHLEARATFKALAKIRQKRPFIISRASFPGQGVWSGHWTGDIDSSWEDMRQSIPDILNFGLYGMPIIGADICGFQFNTTEELCTRWQALGAFYPFMRNHNDRWGVEQDPAILGPRVLSATKKTLERRLFMLPYLYTLFYKAHVEGATVARSLMTNFPDIAEIRSVDTQFMWGDALMIVPALFEGQKEIEAVFPPSTWYHVNKNYKPMDVSNMGNQTLPVIDDDIHLFVRGGYIIPAQKHEMIIKDSRKNSFTLIVALDSQGEAKGELFWDDGDSIDTVEYQQYNLINFAAANDVLFTSPTVMGYSGDALVVDEVCLLGVETNSTNVVLNKSPVDASNIKHDEPNKVLRVYKLGMNLSTSNTLMWS